MPTGQQIVTKVATYLNLMDPSGTLGASDSAAILATLNTMWDRWGVDEGLIYAVTSGQFPVVAAQQAFVVGTGGAPDWNTTRPARIYGARIVNAIPFTATTQTSKTILVGNTAGIASGMSLLGPDVVPGTVIVLIVENTSITVSIAATGSNAGETLVAVGLARTPLDIVDSTRYYGHKDLAAKAYAPDEIYPDYLVDSNGNMRIYLWPTVIVTEYVPPLVPYLELDYAVPFTAWTLNGSYSLPSGYQDAIEWAAAFRSLAIFPSVSQEIAQIVSAEGTKAEAAIREMNARNRKLPAAEIMTPGAQISPQPAAQQGR